MPRSKPDTAPVREVVLVHSSDTHVDDSRIAALPGGDGTAGLRDVLGMAKALHADVVLLAGDTFENNQLGAAVLDRAGQLLADAGTPIVILPGNHDPALPDSVFIRGGFDRIPNVRILGITDEEAVSFGAQDPEIWGHAHRDYFDMAPLRGPRPRSTRWQVAMAHGHYEPPETRANPLRPSWIFSDKEIAATGRLSSARPLGPCDARRQGRRSGPFIRGRRGLPARSIWCG
jgi:hypothetical protein